jgi:hypothetical protein
VWELWSTRVNCCTPAFSGGTVNKTTVCLQLTQLSGLPLSSLHAAANTTACAPQARLARVHAKGMLLLCKSLMRENPASMDASDADATHLLELAIPVTDFMFDVLGTEAPLSSPQTLGGGVPGVQVTDHLLYTMCAWGVVGFCCERLAGLVQKGALSNEALEGPLLRQGLLLKWLPGIKLLQLELAAQGLLDLACCTLDAGGSCGAPVAGGGAPAGSNPQQGFGRGGKDCTPTARVR